MKITSYCRVLVTVVAIVMLTHTTYAQMPSRVRELICQSDFIGFVQADPNRGDPRPGKPQQVDIYGTEPLKGFIKHDYGNGFQYPWMYTSGLSRAGYPTWFAENGEYLVFGRLSGDETFPKLLVLAAFPVTYQPDTSGRVAGNLFDATTLPPLSREQATLVLQETIRGTMTEQKSVSEIGSVLGDETGTDLIGSRTQSFLAGAIEDSVVLMEATSELDAYLDASRRSLPTPQTAHVPTFEEREAQAKQLAAMIRPGTTREEVEEVFPESDGGAFGSNGWRYYFGSEVMIGVPFDTTGGAFTETNKVNGPLTVYRSMKHLD